MTCLLWMLNWINQWAEHVFNYLLSQKGEKTGQHNLFNEQAYGVLWNTIFFVFLCPYLEFVRWPIQALKSDLHFKILLEIKIYLFINYLLFFKCV
jgi:hypothetical protein